MIALSALKSATKDRHDALEATPLLARLAAPDLTRPEYITAVRRLGGFHAAAEERLSGFGHNMPLNLDARRKAHLAVRDLRDLGLDAEDNSALSTCPFAPDPVSIHAAFGVLYVLEGATLGGRVLVRHLRQSIGVDGARGASFFHPYGQQTGVMWRDFCRATERAARGDDSRVRMVRAAQDAFDAMHRWISVPVEDAPVS